MKLNQSILTHLKRKGYKVDCNSTQDVIDLYNKLYKIDISKKEIIKNSSKNISLLIDNNEYLYSLIDNKNIVYVGITNNPIFRVGEHIKFNKKFNSVYIRRIKSNEIPKEIEYKFIAKFKPKYNSQTINNDSVVNFINENIY